MMTLDEALAGVTSLCLDTAPLIYFVEANPTYLATMRDVLRRIDSGAIAGLSSVITLTEVLTQPKKKGNSAVQEAYRDVLLHGRNFSLIHIDEVIADSAATLRAVYNLRTPDALQIAAGMNSGCDAFLTNDAALERVKEIRVLTLDKLKL